VSKGNQWMATIHVKGSSQGVFQEDGSWAGKDRTRCAAVKFRGEVPHDVRGGKYVALRHEPVSVIHEWSPATVQFVQALWSNEVLDEVVLAFLRGGRQGGEHHFATLTLMNATVAYAQLTTGHDDEIEGEHRQLCDVGLHAEKMEFTLNPGSGQLSASYDRNKT
jgi:type VI secretion system Hcp family effector